MKIDIVNPQEALDWLHYYGGKNKEDDEVAFEVLQDVLTRIENIYSFIKDWNHSNTKLVPYVVSEPLKTYLKGCKITDDNPYNKR